MRTKVILPLTLFLIVLAVGYTAWWFYLAGMMRDWVDGWTADERRQGGTVEVQALTIDGFPLAVTATATEIAVRRADGTEWHGPKLTARLLPWKFQEILLNLEGRHRLQIPTGREDQAAIGVTAAAGTGRIGLPIAGAAEQAQIALADATLDLPLNGSASKTVTVDSVQLRMARPAAPPADHTQTGLTVQADLNKATLPPDIRIPLGQGIDSATLTARVMGPLPARFDEAEITAWSQNGGTVEVDGLTIAWGSLKAAASGTLALDKQLQPTGAMTAEIQGINPTLDSFTAAGMLRPNDAAIAKVALGLLSKRKTADGQPVVEAPLTAQNGWLYIGPIRLAPLPRLNLP